MRKIISLILFAIVCLSLCAFGKIELTPEEREKIFFEVAEEKGILDLVNFALSSGVAQQGLDTTAPYIPGSVVVESDNASYSAPNLQPGQHYLEILDAELIPMDNGIYSPNIKVKNLFPEDASGYYPGNLRIYVTYLDKDGFGVQSSEAHLEHIGYGEGAWTSVSPHIKLDHFDVSEISSISVTGYRFVCLKGTEVIYNEEFTFSPPISFSVEDLLPDGNATNSENSSVTVEEAKFETYSTGIRLRAKVRNTSELKRDVITVYFKILDHAGDIIDDGELRVKDLGPGQAAKGVSNPFSDVSREDVSAVEFISYSYGTFSGGSKSVWISNSGGDFSEPFTFTLDELK